MKISTQFFEVSDKKIPDLLKNKKVVIISDLHNNRFGKNNKYLIDTIEHLQADALIVAGDLFNGSGNNHNSICFFEYITKKYPVYMVKGNHEENLKYLNEETYEYLNNYKQPNFVLLDNSCISFYGAKLYGFTSDEESYKRLFAKKINKEEIEKKLGNADENCYNIVVSHNPAQETAYVDWGADVIISGHLHGGFIRFKNKGIITPQLKLFPKYTSGMYEIKESRLIISRGLGTHFPSLRFFNPAHLIVLEFK